MLNAPPDNELPLSSQPLPPGWRTVRLGDVCEVATGTRDPRRTPDELFVYVDISSVDNRAKRIINGTTLRGSDAPSRARQVIRSNDVIVATTRPNLNAVALISAELDNQICSTGFCVLRPIENQLDPFFLFWWAQSLRFVSGLSDLVKGALYPAVSDTQVYSQEIPLPPLPEQRRIAAILTEQMKTVERARAAAEAQLEAAKTLPVAYLRHVFPRPGQELPPRWRWVRLGEVLRVKSGDFLPSSQMNIQGPFPVYGGNGITGRHSAFMFEESKVIIGRVGALCGCVHITEEKSWVTDNALYVETTQVPVDAKFLFYCLTQLGLRSLANQMGQPVVSANSIYAALAPLPPLAEQRRIAAVLNGRMAAVEGARKEIEEKFETIERLPAALLREAFAGRR